MLDNLRAGAAQLDLAAEHLELAPVQHLQEQRQVGGDHVDHLLLQRVLGGQADRFTHCALGPLGIAPVQLRQTPDIGRGIVDLLALEGVAIVVGRRLVLLLARLFVGLGHVRRTADLHRRRRAEIGAGRHRRDVAGIQDVGAGARRPRAARRHVADHRNRTGEDRLDDRAHGGVQPARRVHADHDQRCLLFLGTGDAAHQVVGGGRPDRTVDAEHHHRRAGRRRSRRKQREQQQ
ncbi:hypothetical protein D3C78_1073300 [compost metagenome]